MTCSISHQLASAYVLAETLYAPHIGSNVTIKNFRAALERMCEQAKAAGLLSAHSALERTAQERYVLGLGAYTLELIISESTAPQHRLNQVRAPQSFAAYRRVLAPFVGPRFAWLEPFFLGMFRRNTPVCSFQLERDDATLWLFANDSVHRTTATIVFSPLPNC